MRSGAPDRGECRGLDDAGDALRIWADEVRVHDRAMGRRKLREGAEASGKAIDLDPGFALAHGVRGALLVDPGRAEEGLQALEVACRLDPSDQWSRYEKGRALMESGRAAEAVDVFEQAAAGEGELAWSGCAGRVLALRRSGRTEEAQRAKAEYEEKGGAAGRLHLARGLARLDAVDEALEQFWGAIQVDPALADAHNELAWHQAAIAESNERTLVRCTRHANLAMALANEEQARANYCDTLGWIWYLRALGRRRLRQTGAGGRRRTSARFTRVQQAMLQRAKRYLNRACRALEVDWLIRYHLRVVERTIRLYGKVAPRGRSAPPARSGWTGIEESFLITRELRTGPRRQQKARRSSPRRSRVRAWD